MQPEVSVIILNWNGEKIMRRFLPEVLAHTPRDIARVIVADNGSSDGSVAMLDRDFPGVAKILLDSNYGFAEGYNRAIAQVDTPYVVLLNSDVAPTDGWVVAMLDYMKSHPRCAACQPKLRSVEAPEMFEYAGATGGYLDRNGYPYCRGRVFGTVERDEGQYDSAAQVDWASGAALMARRDLYLAAGGLDPRFFAHMEEIDLCWRLRLMGYTVDAVPAAVVMHLGGGSLPADDPRKTYLNFRNNLLLLYKNLPPDCRGKALVRRRLLDTIAWAKFAATLKWRYASAIVKAHRDYRKMRKAYDADPALTAKPDAPNLLKGRPNILTAYYLRGRRTFDKL